MTRTVSLAALAAVPGLALSVSAANAQEEITLEFVVWNYSLDIVQDNIAQFEKENPNINVNLTDYAWPDYQDSLVLRFRGDTRTDVVYGGQDWLPAWAAAGWIAPLSEIAPQDTLDTLAGDMADFARNDITYDDELYGLPYYAGTISFIYNQRILEEAGIEVPETWADVMDAAEQLQEGGMSRPIVYEYNQELPNFFDAFAAQVYGRGGRLFNDQNEAIFDNPDNAAYKHLEWLQQAFEKNLVQPESHESKIIPTMNTGEHAFTIVYNYVLAAMNNEASQPLAGEFQLAAMPGETHETLGFSKFYAVTDDAAADPARAEAAWKFIRFMGRKPYEVAERWSIEQGLGFGQLPLLEDEDIRQAWGEWVDMEVLGRQVENARSGNWTEWTAIWSTYFRPLLAQAMVGEATVEETMASGAQRWNELRDQYANR